MRRLWKTSLALSLGLLVNGARGQEAARPPARATTPAAAVATLDRPVPLAPAGARVDPQVRPIAFNASSGGLTNGTAVSARPLPVGPPTGTNATVQNNDWRPPDLSAPPGTSPTGELAPVPAPIPGPPAFGPAPGLPFTTAPGAPPAAGFGDDCGACAGGACAGGACDGLCCDGCGGCGWGGCCGCCPPGNRFYGSVDYLLWWIRGSSLPPLVTTGSINDAVPGALGQPGTQVLFGNQTTNTTPNSGLRFLAGWWFGNCHTLGVEVGGFFLGDQNQNFLASSGGDQLLTRPFINAATGMQTTELVSGPGQLAGSVSVQDRTRFWGYQANLRSNICCGCNYYVDLIGGFRAYGLDDTLTIQEQLTVLRSPGGAFGVTDRFSAFNRFYGGQIGAEAEFRRGKWFVNTKAMLALGDTHQSVTISGNTVISDPVNGAVNNTGGLLALPSNIGTHSRDVFTVIPNLGLNVGYQFTNHLRAYVGYNYIYWSSVARAGNQIDHVVNTNQLPPAVPGGPSRPAFQFNGTDFWAQGVNFGLEFRY